MKAKLAHTQIMLLQPHVVLVVHSETLQHENYENIFTTYYCTQDTLKHTTNNNSFTLRKRNLFRLRKLCTNTARVESVCPNTTLLTPHLQNVRLYSHSGVDDFSRCDGIELFAQPGKSLLLTKHIRTKLRSLSSE